MDGVIESTDPTPSHDNHQPVVVTSRRLMAFAEDGTPTIVDQQLDTTNRQIVDKMAFQGLLLPYKGELVATVDEDTGKITKEYVMEPEFEGLTNLEVATIRQIQKAADGDTKVYQYLIERQAGKSVEKSMSMNTTVSFDEWLDQMQTPATATPVPPTQEYPDHFDVPEGLL